MIINITKSQIFTKDPAIRFAKEYSLPLKTWGEFWRRYKLLEYSNGDLRDFLFIKHARNLSPSSINRWIMRGRVYDLIHTHHKNGVEHVNTIIFGDLEEIVINELVKPLKNGAIGKADSII